ncbi:hypothetical protein QEJ31_05580 [Pigmentibacter sp. JX0631]|uniref:hypothetical protein n=1 Tax=Pigmentibacter sp. JX0631 TaxID=2976982 RepID=UPI0024694950|nr:hypothetical protein [Pigmentibacter sp. JX0631]WGL61064.1 hypothetical protein QEJ31_05580 [Pigmentibacter sp. JX0631]
MWLNLSKIVMSIFLFLFFPVIAQEVQSKISKNILFIGYDFKNGGISKVFRSFEEAVDLLHWNIKKLDAEGDAIQFSELFRESILEKPSAIVIAGHQIDNEEKLLLEAKKNNIKLIGWHANEIIGFDKNKLIYNITTDPKDVINLAVEQIYKTKLKNVGIVVFTDNQFKIARYKAELIQHEIKKCKFCHLLKVVDMPIANAENLMRTEINKLNAEFKNKWTHSIAINDIYFDIENPRTDIISIAAGDGSLKAIRRIKKGTTQQYASVAEPLYAQGWQIANELYHQFSNQKDTKVILEPILLDHNFLKEIQESQIEPTSVIREKYKRLWKIN